MDLEKLRMSRLYFWKSNITRGGKAFKHINKKNVKKCVFWNEASLAEGQQNKPK